jgi:hypothetical protein
MLTGARSYPGFYFIRLFCFMIIAMLLNPLVESTPPLMAAGGVNTAPIIGLNNTLYDGATTSGTLASQGFDYQSALGLSSQSASGGVTTLNTTLFIGDAAGYYVKPTSASYLNRTTGYILDFTARVVSEAHNGPNADKNGDGLSDRAGFSVIAISSDLMGIELAFWQDQVWVQQYDAATNLFTHSPTVETTSFNTTTGLIPYQLIITGNTFSLYSSGTLILAGNLHNYSNFGAPYNVPDFIFLGDDTTSASAQVQISRFSVLSAMPALGVLTNTPLNINYPSLFDLDAGTDNVTASFQVNLGQLQVTASAGVTVTGNNTNSLTLVGPVSQINTLLASSLIYTPPTNYRGFDSLTTTADDGGHNGTGGAKLTQTTSSITIADLLATNPIDDGTTNTAGTLSFAIKNAQPGNTIGIVPPGNLSTMLVNGGSLPQLPQQVQLLGRCNAGKPDMTILGYNSVNNTRINGPGLKLSSGNSVYGITINGFKGTQLQAKPGTTHPVKNSLKCSKVVR